MPTLRSINKMQLEIQRTGTLQISVRFFFPIWVFLLLLFFCFLKRTQTNRRYLRSHPAITVTGALLPTGMHAVLPARLCSLPGGHWPRSPFEGRTAGLSRAELRGRLALGWSANTFAERLSGTLPQKPFVCFIKVTKCTKGQKPPSVN